MKKEEDINKMSDEQILNFITQRFQKSEAQTTSLKLQLPFVFEPADGCFAEPKYNYDDDSGFDLRANITEPVTLGMLDKYLVPTGLSFDIPAGFEIQIRPRSGLAAKHDITVLNSPGTIDKNYKGELKVILKNLGREDFVVEPGDRIAQAVLAPVCSGKMVDLIKRNSLSDSDRGVNGFGSSGKK